MMMKAIAAYDATWGRSEVLYGYEPDWDAVCTLALRADGVGIWGIAEVTAITEASGVRSCYPDSNGELTVVWADLRWPSVPAAARAWRSSPAACKPISGVWLPDLPEFEGEPSSLGEVLRMGDLADALLDRPEAEVSVSLRVHAPDGTHSNHEASLYGALWDGGDGVDRVLCETYTDAPATCDLIVSAAIGGRYDDWLSRHAKLVTRALEEDVWGDYMWNYDPWGVELWRLQ